MHACQSNLYHYFCKEKKQKKTKKKPRREINSADFTNLQASGILGKHRDNDRGLLVRIQTIYTGCTAKCAARWIDSADVERRKPDEIS